VVGGRLRRLDELQTKLDAAHPDWKSWMTFTGLVPDVEKYFAAADAFLFPSYSEAFALVEVEATACGLPLFLTPHHGSEMILQDGINGRCLDFDAGQISRVLAEFVSGQWQPSKLQPGNALDSTAYARRLAAELLATIQAKEEGRDVPQVHPALGAFAKLFPPKTANAAQPLLPRP
jgi:glycosyltransferase involved in cell wall biosynthesis